jgi:hypothetical protein
MPLSSTLMTIAGDRALSVRGMTLLPSLGRIGWLDAAAGPSTSGRCRSCSCAWRCMWAAR